MAVSIIASLLVATGVSVFVYVFSRGPASALPILGPRGVMRSRALERGGWFGRMEPAVRFLAARLELVPMASVRKRIAERLHLSGDWLGLTPDEFLGLCVLGATMGAAVGGVFVALLSMSATIVLLAALLGATVPFVELDAARTKRFRQVDRGLPAAIDLAAMCVGAGLDFPSSIRQVVENSRRDDALRVELERILQELALGRTRRMALSAFAVRVPTDAVRDFVGSVIQAEEKGTPLADVLRTQAGMLRMRRSVMAEEAAARAGLLMMLPLLMIFVCVFLLLLGPFIVGMLENGI